jgi:hypothetical protein
MISRFLTLLVLIGATCAIGAQQQPQSGHRPSAQKPAATPARHENPKDLMCSFDHLVLTTGGDGSPHFKQLANGAHKPSAPILVNLPRDHWGSIDGFDGPGINNYLWTADFGIGFQT